MNHPSIGLVQIHIYHAQVFFYPWFAVVELERKMITNQSGKSWEIYSSLQVKIKLVTANMHFLLMINPAVYDSRLQGFHMIPQFAESWSNVVRLVTRINKCLPQLKFADFPLLTGHSSRETTSVAVGLQKSQQSYMQLRLKIMICSIISFTFPILVTVKTQTLLWSSRSNVQSFIYRRELASISSTSCIIPHLATSHILQYPMSCNIPHLAQQHIEDNLQSSMLQNRTCWHLR